MNRLIIIGNGFDLAHGLKTSYTDFLGWYWGKINKLTYKDGFIKVNCPELGPIKKPIRSSDDLFGILRSNYGRNLIGKEEYGKFSVNTASGLEEIFCYQNELWGKLNFTKSIRNWVDIELVYYKELIAVHRTTRYDEKEELRKINILHKELSEIIQLFHIYLSNLISIVKCDIKNKHIDACINSQIVNESEVEGIRIHEFNKKGQESIANKRIELKSTGQSFYLFDNTLVLNFNYTETINCYLKNEVILNIHGSINNLDNPINFGYGDEKDDSYKELENLNLREPLRFIKSFYYLNSEHYKKLINLIDSGPFQCQIMGHSCGLSDRTLLKAIFEHENCCSIKPYFYKYKVQNEWNEIDNYIEIVQNISRHFDDKIEMRTKIVNKKHCQPLPQSDVNS